MSWLTGQQKYHIHTMENVTLNQKEQTRLQVLNSLLAEQMTLDQAAELMGVRPRHTAVYVKSLYRIAGQDYCRHHIIRAAVAAGVITEVRAGAGR